MKPGMETKGTGRRPHNTPPKLKVTKLLTEGIGVRSSYLLMRLPPIEVAEILSYCL